jgi:hypothetical protein
MGFSSYNQLDAWKMPKNASNFPIGTVVVLCQFQADFGSFGMKEGSK